MNPVPALFAAPMQAASLTFRTPTLPPHARRMAAEQRRPPSMRATPPVAPVLSRRTFAALLAALPLASPSMARADNITALVTPYKDLPKGFTILRPREWNEFEGMQDSYDIKWQDVIQPLEFVTVLTAPVPKEKRLHDLGSVEKLGNKLAGGRGGKLVSAAEKDIDGVPAYVFEIKKGASRQLTLLSVNKQKLYSVNASCSEKRWSRRENLLRGVVDSFKPKL